jgi:hypothetical protein
MNKAAGQRKIECGQCIRLVGIRVLEGARYPHDSARRQEIVGGKAHVLPFGYRIPFLPIVGNGSERGSRDDVEERPRNPRTGGLNERNGDSGSSLSWTYAKKMGRSPRSICEVLRGHPKVTCTVRGPFPALLANSRHGLQRIKFTN